MQKNVLFKSTTEELSDLLLLVGQPVRLNILIVLRVQEACVCHLEAILHMRQATLSQHLMALRNAELVNSRRDGRNIFYSIAKPELVDSLQHIAQNVGLDADLFSTIPISPVPGCTCPICNPGLSPTLTCRQNQKLVDLGEISL